MTDNKYNNLRSSIAPTRLTEGFLIFSLLVKAEVFKDKKRTISDDFLWKHVTALRVKENKDNNMVTCPYETVIIDYTTIDNEKNNGIAEEISQEELEELIDTSDKATRNVVIASDDIDELLVINDKDKIDKSIPKINTR